MLPVFADVVAASGRLEGRVIHTPVMSSERFDARVGRKVLLKCENLQHIGAFKFRGALNTLLQLEAAAAADPSRVHGQKPVKVRAAPPAAARVSARVVDSGHPAVFVLLLRRRRLLLIDRAGCPGSPPR
jgi:hypothetical protein